MLTQMHPTHNWAFTLDGTGAYECLDCGSCTCHFWQDGREVCEFAKEAECE